MSEELDPQPLPQSKEQPQECLHSVAERSWELLQEKGKKGKKAGFQIRDHANHRQAQPHMQQSTGNTGSPATIPINTRDGSTGAADSTILCSQGPALGDRGVSPSRLCGECGVRQVRWLSTYPSQEDGDREDHCQTERWMTRDNREGKTTKLNQGRMPGKSEQQ